MDSRCKIEEICEFGRYRDGFVSWCSTCGALFVETEDEEKVLTPFYQDERGGICDDPSKARK